MIMIVWNFDGTADIDMNFCSDGTATVSREYFAEAVKYEVCVQVDTAERAAWIHDCRMYLFSRLGAVLTASGFAVRYWSPDAVFKVNKSQRGHLIFGYYSGFCSRSRGLHRDRKRD